MVKKSFFKLPKAKKFNYTPRYYDGKVVENVYEFDSKFYRDRELLSYNDRRNLWADARESSRTRGNREFNTRVLLIVAVLVFIFLWIIDFDLSIFSRY